MPRRCALLEPCCRPAPSCQRYETAVVNGPDLPAAADKAVAVLAERVAGTVSVVRLTFTNTGSTDVWFARPRVEGDIIEGDFFEFRPAAGYVGRKVKRVGFAVEELVRVRPHQSFAVVVDLGALYNIDGWSGRVRYAATHPLGGPGPDQPMSAVSSDWLEL